MNELNSTLVDLSSIELNDDFKTSFDLIEKTNKNVFITGKAGTGKSTFLQYFRQNTSKNIVVLAPTGVAAVNIQGQTIHSFFNFRPDITTDSVTSIRIHRGLAKLYRKLDVIVIDEISMVRADLMDCVDAFLRIYGPDDKKPFGGVQMVFIGDLYQLAPVVRQDETMIFQTVYSSPYFFSARVFEKMPMEFVEFETYFRQKEAYFIDILNRIRSNTVEQEHMDALNERYDPDHAVNPDEFVIYLTTTNYLADKINYERVHDIKSELFVTEGAIRGEIDSKNLPTHETLELKVGAQVILLNNDAQKRWVNGSIGKIVDIFDAGYNTKAIQVLLATGERVEVEPYKWEIYRFFYDEATDSVQSEVVGSFRQFPIKLAWAVTIHKAQGKTFDKVIVDVGKGAFCHGQMYVALSRCTTLKGIILKKKITRKDILTDERIACFLSDFQYRSAQQNLPMEEKENIIRDAIDQERTLEITYLKENGVKNKRRVLPRILRPIEFNGQKCLGIEAFCYERQRHWVFRLPCIIDIKKIDLDTEI